MKPRRRWILPVLSVIAILVLPFIACPLAAELACRPIFIAPPIDVSPLAEAEFNPNPAHMEDFLEVSLFDSHKVVDDPDANGWEFFHADMRGWISGNPPSPIKRISIRIEMSPANAFPDQGFASLCPADARSDMYGRRIFLRGGVDDNRYCLYYMQEGRDPIDSGCGATGNYENGAVFRKGRALIIVDEFTDDRDSPAMSEAMSLLAEAISKKAQTP